MTVLRSGERRVQAAAALVLPALLLARTFPGRDGLALALVVLAPSAWCAVRIWRQCVVVTPDGVTDRRTLRVRHHHWDDLDEFTVSRPPGPWGGLVVVAHRRDGSAEPLMATRAYHLVPWREGVDFVHDCAKRLNEEFRAHRLAAPATD